MNFFNDFFKNMDFSNTIWIISNLPILIILGVLICILCCVCLPIICICCASCCQNHSANVIRNNHQIEEVRYYVCNDSVDLPIEYNSPNPTIESRGYDPNTRIIASNGVYSENQ
ncbi:hypothetical protein DMUE_5436 [Dictyocoela muelleri]|nr:hypothetical protein DMUE_5436 [Dictyocoela muelleri]